MEPVKYYGQDEDLYQRYCIQKIVDELAQSDQEEKEVTEELQRLQEGQRVLIEKIIKIRKDREYWVDQLQFESDRRDRIDELREEEVEDEKIEAAKKADAKTFHWNPNKLVGHFVSIRSCGIEYRGVVLERNEIDRYSVVYLDGTVHLEETRSLTLVRPTDTEREILRALGYPHLLFTE
jgi:phosphoenolpyruvate synthase/pyruvate phosphate dikinase